MINSTDRVPLPCPMCNASLTDASASGYHYHPANDCIFSGFEVPCDDVVAWNRRAPATQADHIADERKMVAGERAEAVRPDEVAIVKSLIDVVRATFIALDDSEEGVGDDGRMHVIDSTNFDAVCTAMERLEELPDDRPSYTMDAPGKAEWALRNLLAARSGDDAATPARYFVYDYEGGYNEFTTDAERAQAHQAAIDGYLDTGCDGWSEEVTQVVSGIVTHKTVKTDEERRPAPCAAHPDHDDESCDDCAAWNEWPNHDFETCCRYEPKPIAAPASSTGDQA